ncbi:hypothetical protein HY024_02070, partial [Candidatus Curtissbacteria bacterium]|nr:hypothetical protein [Candidatus Curtissbacteria bacterium]
MILKTFLYWRVCLFAIAALGALAFTQIPNGGFGAIAAGKPFDYWLSWAQWDGGHYLQIAQEGYRYFPNIAFFPLYPLLMKGLSFLFFNNLLFAGLFIANVSFLLFLVILFRFVKENYGKEVARNVLALYVLFPTSFFAVALYSEGLYLFLSAIALTLYYKKKYIGAAAAVALCCLTRNAGLLLFLALVIDFLFKLKAGKFTKQNVINLFTFIAVAILPFSVYCLFLLINYGKSPLDFIAVQTYWGREVVDPFSTLASYIFSILTLENRPFLDYLDLVFTLVFLYVLTCNIQKIKRGIWIYSMLILLIPASTGTLTSMPRYLLASIGAFILIGQILTRHPKFKMPSLFLFLT